ncbi:MAG: hypothetical protein OHK005_02550 [Candidatus Methylacidiphilales bacterium]
MPYWDRFWGRVQGLSPGFCFLSARQARPEFVNLIGMFDLRAVLAHYLRTRILLGEREVFLPTGLRARVEALQAPAFAVGPRRESPRAPKTLEVSLTSPSEVAPTISPPAEGYFEPDRMRSRDEKVRELADLQERALACVKCPHLVRFRSSVVFGEGDPDAAIMFVGEAPGADEDETGHPFVGAAGQLLTKMIGAMGLKREQVYIANVLKCRPDMPSRSMSGNRKPTAREMATCLPYVASQIEIIRPQVIVALGATAVEGLLGQPKVVIGAIRSRWQSFRGIPVMPTYHPAYLLRNQSMGEKRKVWEDLLAVMERVGLPISEKQRSYFLR